MDVQLPFNVVNQLLIIMAANRLDSNKIKKLLKMLIIA